MQIADLFINIGLKGGSGALKGLGAIGDGLSNVASTSLATKAGILGVVYAAERLASDSANYGLRLQQYGNITGQSIETLGRWQVALRETGVTGEEVEQSFRNLNGMIGKISMGGAAPQGMGYLQSFGLDIQRAAKDADYYMKTLKSFSNADLSGVGLNKAAQNELVRSLGGTDAILSGFRDPRMLNPDMVKPDLSEKQIHANARVAIEMNKIHARVRKISGGLTAEWGGAAIKDINGVIDAFARLIGQLDKLSTKLPIAKGFQLEIAAIGATLLTVGPLGAALTAVVLAMTELDKRGAAHANDKSGFWHLFNKTDSEKDIGAFFKQGMQNMKDIFSPESATPKAPVMPKGGNNTEINLDVTHHGDAKDTKSVGDTHKKGIETAFNLLSAKYQVA